MQPFIYPSFVGVYERLHFLKDVANYFEVANSKFHKTSVGAI